MHEKNKIYKNEQQIVLKKKNEYCSEKIYAQSKSIH